ncbi:hypothetical protein HWV62_44766 [Athelia sp. TMB]|nr:hypothetical protein HWV62_44766 [Athelia sp. TMB]
MSSFDRPTTPFSYNSINPRPLLPIFPHPETSSPPPALPSPPRPRAFADRYTLSTHIIPAAYPRVAPNVPPLEPIPAGLSKEARKAFVAEQTDKLARAHEDARAGEPTGTGLLWNCVNRYVLRDSARKGQKDLKGNGLTLFFAHANGFPKEIWEPSLLYLLADYSGPEISEIWTWEAVQHGDSYLLNQTQLSGRFDWMDNARDIMNFLVNYLPPSAAQAELPVHLPRVSRAEAGARQSTGYTDRTLVVVGHSYGGCSSASVAAHCPALFSSLVLVDPVIGQYVKRTGKNEALYNFVRGALGRREYWASKEEAQRLLQANPFFASWDPAVLRVYVEHGLVADNAGGVKLKTPGAQEALVFASETRFSNETWELLEGIDERIALRWVMAGDMNAMSTPIGDEDAQRVKVWRRPANASNVRLSSGHLLALILRQRFPTNGRGSLPSPLIHTTASRSHARQALAVLLLSLAPTLGHASPLQPRADSNDQSVKIWVPIVVVVIVLITLGCLVWWRKYLASGFLNMGESAAMAAGVGGDRAGSRPLATRELTAEQLVGRGAGQAATPATAAGATAGRRPRRNRRTPSQISTHSLPLYNKEPGDQELVIYRGQEPEDNPDIPVTVVMPPVDEDAEGGHSREGSRTSLYGHLPDSPPNESLMAGDESQMAGDESQMTHDTSTRHLLPPAAAARSSFETIAGSEESASSLLQAVQDVGQDPRGDAPAYFEAIDLNQTIGPSRRAMRGSASQSTPAPADAPSSSTRQSTDTQASQENRGSRRMSGFRGLLNTFTTNTARPPIPPIPPIPQESPARGPGHTRGLSSVSAMSSTDQHVRDRAASRASMQSGTGSMMAVFRTISRQKSHTTLNSGQFRSPSMISLNSISAPLSHTLTRTEISYPASGPTAEQMRLISSRESFARFAVPYGADAIAYAASASRQDLEPTPDYSESHPNLNAISGLPATSSNLRQSQSPLAAPPVEGQRSSSDSSSDESLQEAPADNSEVPPVAEAPTPTEESTLPPPDDEKKEPEVSSMVSVAESPATVEFKEDSVPALPQISEVATAGPPPTSVESKEESSPVPPQMAEVAKAEPVSSTPAPAALAVEAESSSPVQAAPAVDAESSSSVPAAPAVDTDFAPSTEHQTHHKYGSLTPSIPPTSYRPTAVDMRPESRSSSMMSGTSFATADDDMYESAPSGRQTPEEMPSTPMPKAVAFNMHARDFTDATITPRAND